MTKAEKVQFVIDTLEETYPKIPIPLDHKDPYTLLIAVLLSAQSTDVKVNQITPLLFERADNPYQMVKLSVEEIREIIKPVGLSPMKSKGIHGLSEILIEKYNGEVPADMEALESLPAVGHKTASVVMNMAFGAPTIAVDTHIFRVANRTGMAKGKTPLAVEKGLEKKVPHPFRVGSHHWMILHGRYICKARTPECWRCPVVDLCDFKAKVLEKGAKPAPAKKPAARKAAVRKPAAKA